MILYIGNNIQTKSKNITTMVLLSRLLEKEGFNVVLTSSAKNQVFRLLEMLWDVFKFRNKISYVLIDTYSTKNFYFAFFTSQLCRILKLNYIPILHGGKLPERLNNSRVMSGMIFNNSFKNVAPSNFLKEEFQTNGFSVDYIPNILEVEKYQFKQRNDIKPNLLFVRAFDKIYNPTLAVKVLKEVLKRYPSAKLCMVGPDKDGSLNECKQLAKELNIDSSIVFTGKLSKEEWKSLSNNYDIFINPTNFDNTPISVMEAMALGLVIVSTNVGGMPYLIENNFHGILVEPDNPFKMSDAIIKLIDNQLITRSLINNAHNKVMKFDWSYVRNSWLELLNN